MYLLLLLGLEVLHGRSIEAVLAAGPYASCGQEACVNPSEHCFAAHAKQHASLA